MPTKLKELHEEVESARAIWELLIALANKHPFASSLLVFLTLVFILSALRTQWLTVSTDFKEHPRLVLGMVAALAVSAGLVTVILRSRPSAVVKLLSPPAKSDILSESVTVTWGLEYRDAKEAKSPNQVSYIVQYRSNGTTHETRNFVQYQAFEPAEGPFEWRVRAAYQDAEAQELLSDWSPWQTNFYYRSTLTRIRMTRTLRVGVSKDYLKPFIYHDETLNDLDGIDIRVIRSLLPLLAKALAVPSIQAKYVPNSWLEGNSADLRSGATDVAIGETAILSARESKFHIKFTKPYRHGLMALVSARAHPIRNISTARLTAWEGTTFEQVAQQLTNAYESSTNIPEMLQKMSQGKVDGFIDAAEIAWNSLARNALSELNIKIISRDDLPAAYKRSNEYPGADGMYVAEREIALLDELNRVLCSPEEQETLNRIQRDFPTIPVSH